MAKRQIQVGSKLIYHVIEGQAGTFAKALLEFVMNSIDARADSIRITLTETGFIVKDDGKGVSRIDDVLECLATLGFDHGDNEERVFGTYGLGRAQAWAFAPTTMRTSTYQMDVDIRNQGLDYELHENLPEQKGFTVEGSFYDPMLPSDVDRTARELEELAKYSQVPIYLNGEVISKHPDNQKWDMETDDLYIKLQDKGDLAVYNLGVLVRRYPAHSFGTGGIAVSKRVFEVNMARNDILESKCALWKETKRLIRQEAGKKTRKRKTINDTEAEFLLRQLINGDIRFHENESLRLLKDITGKRHPISRLKSMTKDVTFCTEDQRRLGIRAHEKKLAFVLSPSFIDMLGLRSPTQEAVRDKLVAITSYNDLPYKVVPFDGYAHMFNDSHEPLDTQKDLNKMEQAAIKAMNDTTLKIRQAFKHAINEVPTKRNIIMGLSETAHAWTDGATYVAVERETAKLMRKGIQGCTQLASILIHEFCHDAPDLTGHSHSPEFYEKFHEVVIDTHLGVGYVANHLLKNYTDNLKRRGLKPTKAMLDGVDQSFKAENVA